MTAVALTLATVGSAKRSLGPVAWIEAIGAITLMCVFSVGLLAFVVWALCFEDRGNGSDDDGGDDGGGGAGDERTPPRGSPGHEPSWWPEFERELALYQRSREELASPQ